MERYNPCLEANDQIRYSKENKATSSAHTHLRPLTSRPNSLLGTTTIVTRTHFLSNQMSPNTTHSVPPAVDISALLARRWKAERYEIRALYKRMEDSWTNAAAVHSVRLSFHILFAPALEVDSTC